MRKQAEIDRLKVLNAELLEALKAISRIPDPAGKNGDRGGVVRARHIANCMLAKG